MTLPELLVLLTTVFMPFDNFSPQPKRGKKPRKARTPIPKRGGLPRLAVWKRSIPPTPEIIAEANRRAAENIEKSREEAPTVAMITALKILNVEYHQEKIVWYDGSLYVMPDFWLPHRHVVCELDGFQHRYTKKYDREKDDMVRKVLGVSVLRDWNAWFIAPDLVGRLSGRLIEIDRLRRLGMS